MTITNETRTAGPYTGNGVTTAFVFAFKVFEDSDLQVVQTDTDDVETTLELTTDYTVSLNANQNTSPGGTVTLNSALTNLYTLDITSAVPNTQLVDITNRSGFFPEVITGALDRATIQVQQMVVGINEISNRVTVVETEIATVIDTAETSATAAAASATAAASSATAAAGSATAAASSATASAVSAAEAAGYAGAAAVSNLYITLISQVFS